MQHLSHSRGSVRLCTRLPQPHGDRDCRFPVEDFINEVNLLAKTHAPREGARRN